MTRYHDRRDAGRALARALQEYAGDDVLVLALPRGGVPVGYEVARHLGVPLDVFVVRKLGVPGHEELAMGAIASGGVRVVNGDIVAQLDIPEQTLDEVARMEAQELERRERQYRGERPPIDVRGRTVLLVDDGLATGSTMRAAVKGLRQLGAREVVVAVPVGAAATCEDLSSEVDDLVCPLRPHRFHAVGLWYDDFSQTRDEEVRALLDELPTAGSRSAGPAPSDEEVRVLTPEGLRLEGTLSIPARARGVVLFAHGSGSSRHSPRNRSVAGALQQRGLATLLIDLLTAQEEAAERWTRHLRFDIGLLAERLVAATRHLGQDRRTRDLPVGYFGSSTGAAAALVAATEVPDRIAAVVSRGGRPDLAGGRLPLVRCPTLLIVGGDDEQVLELNRGALRMMDCQRELEVIPGATHLFEEPGALEEVARLAAGWFSRHLPAWTAEPAPSPAG